MSREAGNRVGILVSLFLIGAVGAFTPARGGHLFRRSGRPAAVSRARPVYVPSSAASDTLGIFRPTPYITVGGDYPSGGGYSPLGIYGDQTMALYGPTSSLRPMTAPVVTYTRGYGGEVRPAPGNTSLHTHPPRLSPVHFPQRLIKQLCSRAILNPMVDMCTTLE